MSRKPLVILHGWSDSDDSFLPLAESIENETQRSVEHIWLGNYVSLDDDVRMRDLVNGLSKAWKERKLPTNSKSVDMIVHSTGALVIRDWMYSEYISQDEKSPVNNLVMLAPANFGSPLAHKGRAFYGRVFKGFGSKKRFQTGTHILKALEMASPYSWDLALKDRFESNHFGPQGVRATVIVGNRGYRGISSLANESGSDGTVYVSTANLNCEYMQVDFPSLPRKPTIKRYTKSKGKVAFLIMDDHDHSSIALKDPDHDNNRTLLESIVNAINLGNANAFNEWVDACAVQTRKTMDRYAEDDDDYKHEYQNTVIRVTDDQGFDVTDYVIEFYRDANLGILDRFTELFNKKAVSKVHAYSDNSAYKSFMMNCTELFRIIDEKGESLKISLSAMPDINDEKNMVGYRTFEDEDIDSLSLGPSELSEYFKPNRTLFVDITLTREQKDQLFTLNKIDEIRNR